MDFHCFSFSLSRAGRWADIVMGKNNAMNVIDVLIGGVDVINEKAEGGRGFRGGIDRNDREGRVYEL